MMKVAKVTLLFFATSSIACAQQEASLPQQQCVSEQKSVSGISEKYKSTFDSYQKEGEDLKNSDAAAQFKFDVTWADTEIRFGTPSVTVKDQKIIFGVPQVTMKLQEIVFGTPSVRMKRIKTGQYPEFFCEDTWISVLGVKTKGVPNCTVRWSDTFADVPEPFMQEQRIKTDIPEFKWADTQIIMGIPEFFMQQQKIVLGLPQFKLNSVIINPGALKDKSEDLQNRVATTRGQLISETGGNVHSLFSCYRGQISAGKAAAGVQFNNGLAQIDAVIQSIKSQGGDPTKMTSADGTVTDLLTARLEVIAKRDSALATFDAALKTLDENEKQTIEKLSS
ncbi:hypothetical protein GJ699_03910 [Duganella sp. FT80W]|uniref:Uncharacterized protein n=1 Tax=Duganella guangzhouensis TaxID=2666084 RepID=A0A6I2KUI0_9BURK|nr:hypothetical protein [Duganella guangzhouensis]MRW89122.1 hypothetical protein [Duganella guangzhouensis]